MKTVLTPDFFERPTLLVARDLLGKYLCRKINGKETCLMIVETEGYDGERDLACHARSGKTLRNAPMWEAPGRAYVYFTYGMHWMLNLVCGKAGYPAAVLIRGVEGISGPARLTKALKIDKSLNAKKLSRETGLWVEDRGVHILKNNITRTPRIGVEYAGPYAQKPWRFVLTAN